MDNSAPKKEIIIKCKLDKMVRQFFKDWVVIWHDPDLHSQENQKYVVDLVEKFCEIKTFTEWDKAAIEIRETKKICHVITSGTNGELLVREIGSNENVSNIYLFCRNKDYHTWTKNYPKIACVETKIEAILDQIQKKLLEWSKQRSSLKLNLPAFAPIFNDTHKSKMNNLHRFLKFMPRFQNREQAKHDFTTLSREIYSDKRSLKLIADFEQNYAEFNMEKILRWYTQESFLYKVTNNGLRIATSDSIQYCRLPLRDLQEAIKEQYQKKSKDFNGLLYRAAPLDEEEWQILKDNTGSEIEMHGFLSASKEKNAALKFMGIDPRKKVFITILVPKGPNDEEQGFAEIEEFSQLPYEREVLFNVRSRFTVLEAEEKYSEELPSRHLVLLYGAHGFRKFIAERSPVQEVFIPENVSCTRCKTANYEINGKAIFVPMTNSEKNNNYYCNKCIPNSSEFGSTSFLYVPLIDDSNCKISLPRKIKIRGFELIKKDSQVPFYGYKCSKCQAKKQKAYLTCTYCDKEKIQWCGNCFENTWDCIRRGHPLIFESSPFSFWSKKMSKNELNHFNIQNCLVSENDLLQQAVMFFKSHEYEKAIEYYQAFIDQNKASGMDFKLGICYHHLGLIFSGKGELQKTMEYYRKSLDIFKATYRENHPVIAVCYNNIGTVYERQKKLQKAMEYYWKSLDIRKSIHGENHPETAHSYNNIGVVYSNQGEFQKATEYSMKSLDIRKSIYGDSHPETAQSYNNIGTIYEDQGKLLKAMEYFLKALEIKKSVYGENHPETAQSYNNIGVIYKNQGEFQKAMEFFRKSLEIRKSINGENHPETALSYNNIGMVYSNQGEFQKAMKYCRKSLDIFKSIHGENHPETALSYNNIGIVFQKQGELQKALKYFLKALEIKKSVYGEDHPETIRTRNSISFIQKMTKVNNCAHDDVNTGKDTEII